MVRKFTPIADGGRKDKATGKNKNIVGDKPKVYGNSNWKPVKYKKPTGSKKSVGPNESYSGVSMERLPKFEREKRMQQEFAAPYAPLARLVYPLVAGLNAASDALGGRKNIIYRQGKTPTKRQTGK